MILAWSLDLAQSMVFLWSGSVSMDGPTQLSPYLLITSGPGKHHRSGICLPWICHHLPGI